MSLKETQLDLALLQINELAGLYGKDSPSVRLVQTFHQKRRALKKQTRLFFRRLFKKPAAKPKDKLKVLVHVRGGIGDVCMARLFVCRLREKFPTALIYFCFDNQSTVEMVFSDGIIDGFVSRKYDPLEYDLVIAGCHAFNFDYYDLPRLQQLAPGWMNDFKAALALQQKIKVILNNTPHLDGLWAQISVQYGSSRVANMGWTAGIAVGQNDRAPIALPTDKMQAILQRHHLCDGPYITIHDGTNTNTDLHGRHATRCWPRAHWEKFALLFKKRFPHIRIVQLGAGNSVPFDFADICLVGKTTVAELPYILQSARLHIDGESGMAHLANLTDVQSIVLFGPSPMPYLAYARNVNLRAGDCRDCMCIFEDWMSRCPLFANNNCLIAIRPERVMAEAERILTEEKTSTEK